MLKTIARRALMTATCAVLASTMLAPTGFAADKKLIAFVVNVPADFWASPGAALEKAQAELPNYNIRDATSRARCRPLPRSASWKTFWPRTSPA